MVIDERAGSSAQCDLCDCDVCMCWDERHRPAHVCDRFVRVMMLTAYLDRDSKARTLVMLFFVCAVVVSSLGGARTVALHAGGRLRAPRWVGVRAACRSVFRLLFCARAGVSVASAPLRPSQSWVLMFLWR